MYSEFGKDMSAFGYTLQKKSLKQIYEKNFKYIYLNRTEFSRIQGFFIVI